MNWIACTSFIASASRGAAARPWSRRSAAAVGRLDELSRQDCRDAVERRFSARRMAADHVRVYRSAIARRDLQWPAHETHSLRQTLDLHPPGRADLDVDRRLAERHAAQPQ